MIAARGGEKTSRTVQPSGPEPPQVRHHAVGRYGAELEAGARRQLSEVVGVDEAAGLVGGFAGLVEVASLGHRRTYARALAQGNSTAACIRPGATDRPPNVEIALVAEDAAYRIAVDAGCEQLAARPTSQRASASAMCATRRDAGRARDAAVDKPARVATELPLSRWSSARPRARWLSQRTRCESPPGSRLALTFDARAVAAE